MVSKRGQGKRYYYRKTDGKLGWVQNKKSDKMDRIKQERREKQ